MFEKYQNSVILIVTILFIGCGLPREGEIIENKLTQKRYEISCSDKLLECLDEAKMDSSIYNFRYREGNKVSIKKIFIYLSRDDSIRNPEVITYYKDEDKERRIDSDIYFYFTTKDWEYVEKDEFNNKWEVVN